MLTIFMLDGSKTVIKPNMVLFDGNWIGLVDAVTCSYWDRGQYYKNYDKYETA
jgi:hypothetical protein